uniref:Tudor domain-containing protein n=1 Tax=Angiostrongylus cantonensis TaxID=6313 RepID=A0A0K0CZ64_ANGCA
MEPATEALDNPIGRLCSEYNGIGCEDVLSTRFERVNVNCIPMKLSDSCTSVDSSSNNRSPTEKSSDDMLSLMEFESEEKSDAFEQLFDSEIEKEIFMVIGKIATEFPPPKLFKKGEKFLAKVLSAVSPLEFYVIRDAHIRILRELERIISYFSEKLCGQPLLDSQCHRDHACLVRFDDILARAKIGHSGTDELQVYLIDYGRSMFISRSECFAIPTFIAKFASPLAHYCTLNGFKTLNMVGVYCIRISDITNYCGFLLYESQFSDVDSRALDHATVIAFHEKILSVGEITLKSFGESRRTHGELVELVD